MKVAHALLILKAIAESEHGLRLTEIVKSTRLGIVQVDVAMAKLRAAGHITRAPIAVGTTNGWQITRSGLTHLIHMQEAA